MENPYPNSKQALQHASDAIERRLVKHRPVATALRGGSAAGADEVLELAHAQIRLWEQQNLCSQDYIDAWKELLQHPIQAAWILEERSSRAAALRQNSPFVASIRKFEATGEY
jgi:hypothetical protein